MNCAGCHRAAVGIDAEYEPTCDGVRCMPAVAVLPDIIETHNDEEEGE